MRKYGLSDRGMGRYNEWMGRFLLWSSGLMMQKDAVFGGVDSEYRYALERTWDERKPKLMFLMLNPSTADANIIDRTVGRCLGYAQTWGYGGLLIGNVFALRSTDPKVLRRHRDPVGPDNDFHLKAMAERSELIVAGWGTNVRINPEREDVVKEMFAGRLFCLALNSDGTPGHPLYLKAGASLLRLR